MIRRQNRKCDMPHSRATLEPYSSHLRAMMCDAIRYDEAMGALLFHKSMWTQRVDANESITIQNQLQKLMGTNQFMAKFMDAMCLTQHTLSNSCVTALMPRLFPPRPSRNTQLASSMRACESMCDRASPFEVLRFHRCLSTSLTSGLYDNLCGDIDEWSTCARPPCSCAPTCGKKAHQEES